MLSLTNIKSQKGNFENFDPILLTVTIKPGEMGYKEAWERLHSEYGQNKLVINAHVDEIAHLPVLRGTNYAKIQEFYENESKKFDALLMLGEADMLQGFAMSTLNNSHM